MLRSTLGIWLLIAGTLGTGQQNSPAKAAAPHDAGLTQAGRGEYKPDLPLQRALKIAEDYVEKQHIDVSTYWLSQAHWILYGSESQAAKDRRPAWHFLWTSNKPGLGDYVEIIVFMDGSVMRAVSM